MKVILTGAKGFIGGNLLKLLKDFDLVGIARKREELEQIKIYSFDELSNIQFQPEVIIICHGAVASGTSIISDTTLFESNITLTNKILNKFRNAFVIYLSTCSVYEINELGKIKEDSPLYPRSTYSISKIWGENLILQRRNSVVIRLSSVYGTSMKTNTLIPNYISSAINKNYIEVWGQGSREQNYIHVNDIAEMIKKIIEKRKKLSNQILLGVSDREYSNLQVAKIIAKQTNCKIKFVKEDKSPSYNFNNNLSVSILEWNPKVDLKIGIKRYIECVKKK